MTRIKKRPCEIFGCGLAAPENISVQVCRFREDFPGCKLQVEGCKWVAAGPANLQLSTCNLQLVSPRHAWFRLCRPVDRRALPACGEQNSVCSVSSPLMCSPKSSLTWPRESLRAGPLIPKGLRLSTLGLWAGIPLGLQSDASELRGMIKPPGEGTTPDRAETSQAPVNVSRTVGELHPILGGEGRGENSPKRFAL